MRRLREHADEAEQNPVESVLRLGWRQGRRRRLRTDNDLDLGDHVGDHAAIGPQRLLERLGPALQRVLGLAEQLVDQSSERLDDRGVRDVALKLVELARDEVPAFAGDRLVHLTDERRLSDPGPTADQHQFTAPARYALEGRCEHLEVVVAAVQLVGQAQPRRHVRFPELEPLDRTGRAPLASALFEIGDQPGGRLVSSLGTLGHLARDDFRQGAWHVGPQVIDRVRPTGHVGVHHGQRIVGFEWQVTAQQLVQRDAQRIEVRSIVQRAVHAPGLLRRQIRQRALQLVRALERLVLPRQHGRDPEVDQLDHA